MTNTLICPSCQTRLRVPEGATGTSYTCPRCLGEIKPTGGTTIATEPAPARPAPAEPRDERATCPYCHAAIGGRDWRYCPNCAAPLKGDLSPRRDQALDDDFSRDRQRSGWFTILLMAVGIIALVVAGFGALGSGEPAAVAMLVFVLAVVTAIVWAVVYYRTRTHPAELTAGRVAQGVVATIGAFFLGWIALALAVGVFLLAVCAAGAGVRF